MRVIIDKKYRWRCSNGVSKYWSVGSRLATNRFRTFCHSNPKASLKELKKKLNNISGNYAVIIELEDRIIAAVDKIRSYPIFYTEGDFASISNSARALRDNHIIDGLSLLEFQMAGYVTGSATLYQELYQLQAGEVLIWDKKESKVKRDKYYLFYSDFTRIEKEEDLIEELDEINNRIFAQVIEEANGSTIWVPLSGGLDSRLILCKLKQLKYDNLYAFSYGPPGNYEAKIAKKVAKKVDVPWVFASGTMKDSRKYFDLRDRRLYWEFADGLSSVPTMQGFNALNDLIGRGFLQVDDMVVNGQSGDFITGGHIPSLLGEYTQYKEWRTIAEGLMGWIIGKHFSQHLKLLNEENTVKIVYKITSLIKKMLDESAQALSRVYELWECQERQCKYVVNGQRIYDFFNVGWSLPLWHDEHLKFWPQIPLELRYGQKLYKDYLDKFDFYGCFRDFKPKVWRWPGSTIAVVPIARVIRLLLGKRCSDSFYDYCRYIGHYRESYAPYGLRHFLRKSSVIRGPMALNIERWMEENLQC